MYYVETRQTARKSTGGRAPRKQLATKNGKPGKNNSSLIRSRVFIKLLIFFRFFVFGKRKT
jgi:hypothetical protein